ncbi:MAG: hypothetical protein WAN66_23800 [Limnoraphis robusta]|uniref:Uncharacterized protein n=1 Tax=Limnoraphis robusta CS-951 TaxID=1637645 RepID=A0A0F5YD22_9CYAN|nr:hypothetical protein [Limnoraphis robusta]KKD36786.1 hypothetical protein WN50_17885 [Limnoraphis robusta CS-951]KMW70235.1 hypothetical protein WN50_36715 [Limnoraphis robusta CS-951]
MEDKHLASIANSIGQIHCKIVDLARIFDNYNKEFRLIRDELENVVEKFDKLTTFKNIGFNEHRISFYKYSPSSEEKPSELYISFGADSLDLEGKDAERIYQWLQSTSQYKL